MRFQMGTRTPLGIRLVALHVSFSQKICLYFIYILNLSGMLSLKVIGLHSIEAVVYDWLLLARYIEKN
jgi:hypothetical protein